MNLSKPTWISSAFLIFCIFCIFWIAGCAAGVNHLPTVISPLTPSQQRQVVKLEKAVELKLGTGYVRTIKLESQWQRVGSVAQGEVFKSYDGVFTVEGAHVHEAYLVVSNQTLVGFYLPVERGFVPYPDQPQISLAVISK